MQIAGLKFRCYPTEEQQQQLAQTFGCVRKVYNHALHLRTDAWYERQERMNYTATSADLTAWKKDPAVRYLNEVSCVPLQQTLRHLQTAFVNFWEGRADYPAFKSKHHKQSAEYTRSAFTWDAGKTHLKRAKMGQLKVKWSRDIPHTPSTVTISKTPGGGYYVSLRCEVEVEPWPAIQQEVGIDVGLTHTATLSTGEKIGNPKYTRKYEKKLARRQREMARKQKGSQNRNKARLKVAKVHQKIADCRMDFVHKMTTRLIRENQVIVVEDLNVKGMIQHPTLAKHIADVSWGEIFRQLAYKAEWYGRTFVQIDRFYPSSKRCSGCGYIVNKLPLAIRAWTCPSCDAVHDRDHNAAKNIVAAGQAVLACGAGTRPPRSAERRGTRQRSRNRLKIVHV